MKILHLSDLHFGDHDKTLMSNLRHRVQAMAPDVIVCTGDLTNNPDEKLAGEAYNWLQELAGFCTSKGPRLIVVPGNHDIRRFGFLFRSRSNPYSKIFDSTESDHYYDDNNVWIFGFDSASEGAVGGAGTVTDEDLQHFHDRYEVARQEHSRFEEAFKIVLVHHHPLPVNWSFGERDRFLTMVDAGRFLSATLNRRIDLILHGHEHLQARARLWSTLGGNNHEVTVLSLGATLKRMSNPEQNWFGVVTVDAAQAHVEFFASIGNVFGEQPEEGPIPLRTPDAHFQRNRKTLGYFYQAIASVTDIDNDGDARRSIEFDGLQVTRTDSNRAAGHDIGIPPTSGYLDSLRVVSDDNQLGLRLEPPLTIPDDPAGRRHDFNTRIVFDRKLTLGEAVEYSVDWSALNSFALDRVQFRRKYGSQAAPVEFTQYPVTDPIENLTVIAKFPDVLKRIRPRPRVTRIGDSTDSRTWSKASAIERLLGDQRALRYYDTLNLAALRVEKPEVGLSYGIAWDLPDVELPEVPEQLTGDLEALRDSWKGALTDKQRTSLNEMLVRLIIAARELLMKKQSPWGGHIEASFMYFDSNDNLLHVLCAVTDTKGKASELDYLNVTLEYGDGVAGRAFKSNEVRAFVTDSDSEAVGPYYYTRVPGLKPPKVLVAIPVQLPVTAERALNPYGVLNLSSNNAQCPLRQARRASVQWEEALKLYRKLLNEKLLDSLRAALLTEA